MNHKKLILTLCMGMAVPAYAGDLGDINVTATRSESSTSSSSKPVTIIDRETIEASHAESVVDLLKGKAGIRISDTSGVNAKSVVDLGGFGEAASANSVVLIDGRRVNVSDLSGVDWTQIPVEQIERIEIVHGASAVLYGQGAVGGVINIITRIPESGGTVRAEAGSFGTFAGAVRAGASADKVRVELNGSGLNSDGYRKNGRFERYDFGARAEVDLPGEHMLYLNGNHHLDRSGLPGSLSIAQIAANRRQTMTPADYANATDNYITAGLQLGFDPVSLDLPVTYRKRETNAFYAAWGGFNVASNLRTISARPKLALEQPIGELRLHATAGLDFDRSEGSFGGINAKRNAAGYYGLLSLSDKEGLVTATAGYRNEAMRDKLTQVAGSSVKNSKGVYEIGLSAAVGSFTLGLNHSTSVRMPLLDERFDWWTMSWNPALQMQSGKHTGVTARYRMQQAFVELSFSRGDITNEIYYNPATFMNENYSGKTRHDVLMLQTEWSPSDWATLSANYSQTKATFRAGAYAGNDVPAVPKQKAGAAIDLHLDNGFGAILNFTWVGNAWLISDQSNAGAKLPAYLVADISARYRWHDIEFFARIDNLTNRKYSSFGHIAGSYYPAAEISARGGASYHF